MLLHTPQLAIQLPALGSSDHPFSISSCDFHFLLLFRAAVIKPLDSSTFCFVHSFSALMLNQWSKCHFGFRPKVSFVLVTSALLTSPHWSMGFSPVSRTAATMSFALRLNSCLISEFLQLSRSILSLF